MYDIILIQPRIGKWDTIRSEYAPPLSLLSICTLIHKKYKIKIFDQRITSKWKEKLKELILKNNNLICIGITSMIGEQLFHALNIAKFIKNIDSTIPIVLGGVQPTLTPYSIIKNPNIDIIVKGEGELTFSELVECIKDKKELKDIKGIIFKKNGNIIETKDREFIDLNSLPPIPYELVDMRNYLPSYGKEKTFYYQSSRGCPHNCIYCYNIPFNRGKWRALSAERVITDLKHIIKTFKIRHFYFVDDNFFIDLDRAKKIVSLINKENLKIRWQIQGVEIKSLVRMDNQFLSELEKSGLIRITVGIESGSSQILKFLRKRYSIKEIIEVNKKLSNYKFIIFYSIICGFPQETEEQLRRTISLVFKILKDNPNARFSPFYACTPFPGTDLYTYCQQKGYLKSNKISNWIIYSFDFINAEYFTKKKNKFLNKLIFTSIFIDKKFMEYNFSKFDKILKIILNIYKYFARFRLKYMKFNFFFEKFIFDNFISNIFQLKPLT
ncbi:MAG: B12-binding domain-containing radical SAM protein [Promethearchaeota archaeon]